MDKRPVAAALILPLLLAACATDGVSPSGSSTPTPTPTPKPTPTPTPTPTPPAAVVSSLRFNPRPAAGTALTLMQSAFSIAGGVLVPDAATTASGGTAIITQPWSEFGDDRFELKIPNLGVDAVVGASSYVVRDEPTVLPAGGSIAVTGLIYSYQIPYLLAGQWEITNQPGSPSELGSFVFGDQTPAAGMPTSGTATYQAISGVMGSASYAPPGHAAQSASFTGDTSVVVNFSTGALTGSSVLTYVAAGGASSTAFGQSTLQMNATLSQAAFTGTASLGGNSPLTGSGPVSGEFYGQDGVSLGGVFSAAGADTQLVGSFAGQRTYVSPQASSALTILAPAAASVGAVVPVTVAAGYQQAIEGGPSFGPTGALPPAGTVFAITQTALVMAASDNAAANAIVAPDAATNAAGGTLTIEDPANNSVTVAVPSLYLSSISALNQASSGNATASTSFSPLGALDYTVLGQWQYRATGAANTSNTGAFVAGYQTPPSSVPTTGTGAYSLAGGVTGWAAEPAVQGALPYTTVALKGDASFQVNFQSGAITGSFSNMTAQVAGPTPGALQPWNNISVTATISGASISGAVASANAPAGTLAFGANASGTINGGFYGPNAQEIGAVWTLYDGSRAAIGTVGAKQAPSDRRLKRDIEPAGRSRNGLQLYRFRYLTDERVFVGVMAQDLLEDPRFRDAATLGPEGFYWVDYGRLGLAPADIDGMREAGLAATRALGSAAGNSP